MNKALLVSTLITFATVLLLSWLAYREERRDDDDS